MRFDTRFAGGRYVGEGLTVMVQFGSTLRQTYLSVNGGNIICTV